MRAPWGGSQRKGEEKREGSRKGRRRGRGEGRDGGKKRNGEGVGGGGWGKTCVIRVLECCIGEGEVCWRGRRVAAAKRDWGGAQTTLSDGTNLGLKGDINRKRGRERERGKKKCFQRVLAEETIFRVEYLIRLQKFSVGREVSIPLPARERKGFELRVAKETGLLPPSVPSVECAKGRHRGR